VNKKSVCIDARLISAPGIGTYLKNLLFQFENTPWKWVALVGRENETRIPKYVTPIFLTSKIYSIQEQIELSLKIPNVDLFWSPHYNVPCLPIRARKRLASIHDAFHLAYASALRPWERAYARWMMKKAVRLSDQIITCSEFSREQIQSHLRVAGSMKVIAYGVDRVFDQRDASDAVMKKYGIDSAFVLYVGSLKTHKNVRGLIAAFSLLVKRGLDGMKLVIVGGGQGMRNCEDVKQLCIAYPELLGRVCAVGHVPDEELAFFYRCARLFVFPSFYEGFGFPPLEAMRSGCPTVVARAGALPEVCGEGAAYIDPQDVGQMARVIGELLQDEEKRAELVRKGLERSALYCWEKCAGAHGAVIEELLG
jgi:glycosyltransferase involved in cell wall biosynthesis